METNNLFKNFGSGNQNPNWNGYGGNMMNMNVNPQSSYGGGFMNRSYNPPSLSNIPVRVVFSPEQIAPQEIPTNGTPALFPLSDGSCIIAKSLLGNGLFDERVYVLQPSSPENAQNNNQPSEFDQVMLRLGSIEQSLNKVLGDLYGSNPQMNQEGMVNQNE